MSCCVAMAVCIGLVSFFGYVFVAGGFVFSPAQEQPVATRMPDFKSMGRSMAEELEKAWLVSQSGSHFCLCAGPGITASGRRQAA